MRLEKYIIEKINNYLNENKPLLFGKKLVWKKSKNKGYFITTIKMKDGNILELEWSPDDSEFIGWSIKKGTKYLESGNDELGDFEKDWSDKI